ncbi:Vitamin B6 photo-protection and homoeostasis [Phytophthora infestans]|uniref:Vitamin B6 photo-protection and homoeostasis n=1 Tax=Phytophthora infestans TaxID=4787 RepID=A0A833W6X6_PHYIN|nr:Vitamin B6 photo-protection and homoeostasis [Phytophthora infestans]
MHSLLYDAGLGAGAIPTAAAVNRVLRDGLGQFGALDVAVLGEILTPLAPGSFLVIASLTNVAKNVAWLSASATRAGFHNSFVIRENLADVTAKTGPQGIASSHAQYVQVGGVRAVAYPELLAPAHNSHTHFLKAPSDACEVPRLATVSEREEFISQALTLHSKSVIYDDVTLDQVSQGSLEALGRLKDIYAEEKYLLT